MRRNLLDDMKMASSACIDALRHVASQCDAEAEVTIIISHPGTAEDAFMVGMHDVQSLYAILQRLETGPAVECDVSATFVGPDEPIKRSATQ